MGFDELRKLPVPLSEGIPANLLTLRPDVRSAEMGLIASKADVIAAKAAFYLVGAWRQWWFQCV